MTIGWYPGHMNKARKDINRIIRSIDAVIEIVDARIPYSSENPLIHSLIGATRCLKVLNKADLADPAITEQWLSFYKDRGTQALALNKNDSRLIRKLPDMLYQNTGKSPNKFFRIMIVGIPNVGKSTLINILLDRKVAKVGDEPAVTKAQQEVQYSERISLLDTPGILWPKIEDQNSAYRLAACGSIKNTAIEFEDIALYTISYLRDTYPEALKQRYQLETVEYDAAPLLEKIAVRRGCLRKGGVDYTKVSEILLNDFRSGKLGRISLETPADIPPPPPIDDNL